MQYGVDYKKDFNGKYICARNGDLIKTENIKWIDGAEWIWPVFYCRALMRGKFVSQKPCSAKVNFFVITYLICM